MMQPVSCTACRQFIYWPLWIRREHLEYIPLCQACFHAHNYTFIAENVLSEAQTIIRAAQQPISIFKSKGAAQ